MIIYRSWQNGFCIGGRGNSCQLRHYYNERDGQVAQAKRFQDSGVSSGSDKVDFSSPYSVKVRKEVESQRMEEVDLDTGRRRSWVETKEFEVFDLTGETPAKPRRSPLGDTSNKPSVVTNLARELGVTKEVKEAAGVSRGSRRLPLGDINDGRDTRVDTNQCPVCQRTFKSAKGVTTHRSAKNSSCKPGKSPSRSTEETSSISDKENSSGGVLASCSAPHLVRNVQEDSIILIEDTPPARAEVRRSIRAKN